MRVTVTPSGDIQVDTNTPAEAAAFVRELQGKRPAKRGRPRKPRPLELESADESLSPALVDTWNWLVTNDTPDGVTATACAAMLDIQLSTASYRLRQLVEKSLAHRPAQGRYRPGEA